MKKHNYSDEYNKVLEIGRPPNIKKNFPNSKALIVGGKVVDRALKAKGKAMTIAANGRSYTVIRGALKAAQKANSTLLIEIAKSEGTYCAPNFFNLATLVDAACNELGITIPVAIHADHYGIKNDKELEAARTQIPAMFDAGITSIAIDASHQKDDKNLFANIELSQYIPEWAGYETEVGEIKGKEGLSTLEEATFLIQGLNARGIHPDWIALNNGSTHGLEASGTGINVQLTGEIHDAIEKYGLSGAQHGTSGNDSNRLRDIASKTHSTKANVATALQMVSWGLEVNDNGNAATDAKGNFVKVKNEGLSEEVWQEMLDFANDKGWSGGDYKKLNLPFETKILSQPKEIRERMEKRVEDFVYRLLVEVFNAKDTADLAKSAILEAGDYNLKSKGKVIEDKGNWTDAKIIERAKNIVSNEGPEGDFDD